ncbi:cell wall protein DAN4-like isoform X2 [Strongylocentrotus purpuratus]|uniref:NTR domain-containing protein n=1 Tax=Strongylocentrotus purpuratus TaxID=7668 RepID=A0A7M7SYZ3_STRPU|nr:cell wall protein DAN4-like isoform X2 [Strongylocentrotus purpuratus]
MAIPTITSIFIFLAVTLYGTSACSCDEEPPFCSSEFGIKGTVTKIVNNHTLFGEIVHSVRVLEVYHDASDTIHVSTTIDITTPSTSSACGIDYLKEGVTYLISGVTYSGSYTIMHCFSVVVRYYVISDLSYVGIPCSESPTTTTPQETTIPSPSTTTTPHVTTTPSSPTTTPEPTTTTTTPTTNSSSLTMTPTSLTTTMTKTTAPTSKCLCDEESTFCSSSFAIKGTVVNVLGNRSLNEDLQYNVRVQEVYRNSTQAIRVNEILEIQTPASSCGIGSLETGSSYLISGGSTSSFSIDLCTSIVLEVNDVDEASVDIDFPCSASVSTITSFVIIVSVLLSVVFHW